MSSSEPLTSQQEALKARGNELVAAKQFADAVAAFTEAIKLPGGQPAGQAVLYSNRCAAARPPSRARALRACWRELTRG